MKLNKYSNVAKALGLQENQELAVDMYNAVYFNEKSMTALDEAIAQMNMKAQASDVNVQALDNANETIGNLNATVADLNAQMAEKEQKLTGQNAQIAELNAQISTLTKTSKSTEEVHQQALDGKDKEIESLQSSVADKDKEIESLKQSLAAKEAEITEMSKNTPAAPAPSPTNQNTYDNTSMNEDKNPVHFYEAEMSPAELRKALQDRKKQLQAKF